MFTCYAVYHPPSYNLSSERPATKPEMLTNLTGNSLVEQGLAEKYNYAPGSCFTSEPGFLPRMEKTADGRLISFGLLR